MNIPIIPWKCLESLVSQNQPILNAPEYACINELMAALLTITSLMPVAREWTNPS